jgi:hypothetical protein
MNLSNTLDKLFSHRISQYLSPSVITNQNYQFGDRVKILWENKSSKVIDKFSRKASNTPSGVTIP